MSYDKKLENLIKHLTNPANFCPKCHNPCGQENAFCGFCGVANPHFNLESLKKHWEVDSIEEGQKAYCPDFHKFEDPIDAEQPFCVFCGLDVAELILTGRE